jgi:hypothetical protein
LALFAYVPTCLAFGIRSQVSWAWSKTQTWCRWLALRGWPFVSEDHLRELFPCITSKIWTSGTCRNLSHVNCMSGSWYNVFQPKYGKYLITPVGCEVLPCWGNDLSHHDGQRRGRRSAITLLGLQLRDTSRSFDQRYRKVTPGVEMWRSFQEPSV